MKETKWLAAVCAVTVVICALTGCSSGTVQDPPEVTEAVETEASVTEPVRPQDDYYRYVNGDTLADAEFAYGSATAADANDSSMVIDQINGIINEIASGSGYVTGSEEYLIQNAYNLYVDYDFENAEVPSDLEALFQEIDDTDSVEDLLLLDARIYRDYAVPDMLGLSCGLNLRGQYDAIMMFCQMPGILKADFNVMTMDYECLNDLRDYSSYCLQAIGHDQESSDSTGTDLAHLALSVFEATDCEQLESSDESYFRLYSYDQTADLLSNVDLEAYITEMGVDVSCCDEFGVYDPSQLEQVNSILIPDNLEALKALELGKVIDMYGEFVYRAYEPLRRYAVSGYGDPSEDALNEIRKQYGELLDPLYVERYYSEDVDAELRDMCEDIREQYRSLITNADWLTEETRQGLLNKLDNMLIVTGADVVRMDPSEGSGIDCSSYFTFFRDYRALFNRHMNGYLYDEVPRDMIQMRMYEVNACYVPSLNNVTICVASTNEPFFSLDNDYFSNLGGLGATIGHEMGHAFDSNCILYDENGVYDPSWIAPEDTEALEARNEQAVRYFEDNFIIFGIYHIDGEQTLGENYADLGGLEAITGIPQTDEDMQILFEAYARSWCMKIVDESLINQIANDVHSPSWIRVNAMLSTLEAFYEAYDVQEGDGMYIAPENRISRWY